jgi:Ca-activated chloride channel family protein
MILRFATPWLLLLLVFVPFIAVLPVWWKRHRDPATVRYAAINLLEGLPRSWRSYGPPFLFFLRLLVLILLILALARPQAGQTQEIISGQGVDIALALDISGSMASLDFEPENRLEAAKSVIADFVESRTYDRIGLVVFAREAFNQSPPTLDYSVLQNLLNQVQLSTEIGVDDGTAIGLGLANAANMLKDSTAESKVVILLTDGVNNSGQIDPLTAATAAEALGIKVYTIGAAKPGLVPFPYQTVFGVQIVMQESTLDEETLQEIADITGGRYFRATDTAGLEEIYDEINELEKSQIEVRTYTRYQELAAFFLIPGLILLVLEKILSLTILRQIP